MKFISTLTLVLLGSTGTFGFNAALVPTKPTASLIILQYYPKAEFERAVECANKNGLCDVDELHRLADELDQYQGAFFEKDPDLQEKEESDRRDVAEILRLQAELKLRLDYLKKANLFEEDVRVFHDMEEREEMLENLSRWSQE